MASGGYWVVERCCQQEIPIFCPVTLDDLDGDWMILFGMSMLGHCSGTVIGEFWTDDNLDICLELYPEEGKYIH